MVAERCSNFLAPDATPKSERCHRSTRYAWPWAGGGAICLYCAELLVVDRFYCKEILGLVDLADPAAYHPPRLEGDLSSEKVYRLSDARALALDFWGGPVAFSHRTRSPLETSEIVARDRLRAAIAASILLQEEWEENGGTLT